MPAAAVLTSSIAECSKRRVSTQIPTDGPLSWSVPGCVSGWETLRARFGTKPLAEILAAGHSSRGRRRFPRAGDHRRLLARQRVVAEGNARGGAAFLINGERAPRVGRSHEACRSSAASLRVDCRQKAATRSTKGRSPRRSSPIAKRTAAIFRCRTLPTTRTTGSSRSRRITAATTCGSCRRTGRESRRWKCSTCWSSSTCKSLGHKSAEHLHLFVEAKKLAFADRAKFYADPAFGKLPVKELISKEYGKKRRQRLIATTRRGTCRPGDPRLARRHDLYVCGR